MSKLSSKDKEKLDSYSGMTVGQICKRARTTQKATLQDASNHLNISTTHLEAIEADDVKSLPPRVYAVGFVRAYADLLGLDSEKMAYLFKAQFYSKGQTDLEKNLVRPESKGISLQETALQKDPVLPMIATFIGGGVLLFIAFAFFIAWLFIPSDKSGQITIPEVPDEMVHEQPPAVDETFIDAADPLAITEDVSDADNESIEPIQALVSPDEGGAAYGGEPLISPLALKMKAESWVEIRNVSTGKIVLTRTFKPGDVYYIEEGNDILLTSGNAGGIEIFLDGKSLGMVGKNAEIVRLLPLSVEALRLKNAQ